MSCIDLPSLKVTLMPFWWYFHSYGFVEVHNHLHDGSQVLWRLPLSAYLARILHLGARYPQDSQTWFLGKPRSVVTQFHRKGSEGLWECLLSISALALRYSISSQALIGSFWYGKFLKIWVPKESGRFFCRQKYLKDFLSPLESSSCCCSPANFLFVRDFIVIRIGLWQFHSFCRRRVFQHPLVQGTWSEERTLTWLALFSKKVVHLSDSVLLGNIVQTLHRRVEEFLAGLQKSSAINDLIPCALQQKLFNDASRPHVAPHQSREPRVWPQVARSLPFATNKSLVIVFLFSLNLKPCYLFLFLFFFKAENNPAKGSTPDKSAVW